MAIIAGVTFGIAFSQVRLGKSSCLADDGVQKQACAVFEHQ